MFKITYVILSLTLSCIIGIECLVVNKAYVRHMGCSLPEDDDENIISTSAKRLILPKSDDLERMSLNPAGYSGTIAIVGGGELDTNSPYFAAMTALRIGADNVHIYCTNLAGPYIRSFNPDITVFPILNTDINRVIVLLAKADIVILGPGLDKDAHSQNAVIPRVVQHCKAEMKPLIVDLDEYFINQAVLNNFLNYPQPGIILTPNAHEFELLYNIIKSPTISSDGTISIDYGKYGNNIFILRKGCTDVGISSNPQSSWTLSSIGSPKRSFGQGHMLSGAVGIYYWWALKHLPMNVTSDVEPMFHASVGSYAASRIVRKTGLHSYETGKRSMVTSDMLSSIAKTLSDDDI